MLNVNEMEGRSEREKIFLSISPSLHLSISPSLHLSISPSLLLSFYILLRGKYGSS
jgi:hypothetical protein